MVRQEMSPEEFRELLLAKGASAECPTCGAEDWRGLDDVIDLPVRAVGATSHETQVRIPGFAALAPSCGRCGHVRLIDLQLLETAVQGDESEVSQDRSPPRDVEVPDRSGSGQSGQRGQRLTNIWGQPVPKRNRRDR